METVVTSSQMRACDRYAIRKLGIPGTLLMENAGRCVAAVAARLSTFNCQLPVVVICGKGNNGGDGLVAARHLLSMGLMVDVLMVFGTSGLRGEAKSNYSFLQRMSQDDETGPRLRLVQGVSHRGETAPRRGSVIVDALFGSGFSGSIRGPVKKIVEWVNRQSSKVVSVDIPSGLNADNGSVGNIAVRADVTVTMGLRKTGLLTGKGPSLCGHVSVVNLGFSPRGLSDTFSPPTKLVRFGDVRSAIPKRPFNAHKHSVGKILVIAGSTGLTGAAALTAAAALKTGAGAVILAVPKGVYPILARKLTEVMVKPFGEPGMDMFTGQAAGELEAELEWADVVILGPGLGRGKNVVDFVKKLLKISGKRILIDADGLNALAASKGLIRRISANECILTPHTGEMSRLTGKKVKYIENNRLETARSFAGRYTTHLVLKGVPTVTAAPGGELFINSTGNEGMASAGMGDVLSGMIGALWGETGIPGDSAYTAVYLHGLAGNRAAEKLGKRSVTATDLLNEIPYILSIATG